MKFIAQIGFFTSTYEWDKNKMVKKFNTIYNDLTIVLLEKTYC